MKCVFLRGILPLALAVAASLPVLAHGRSPLPAPVGGALPTPGSSALPTPGSGPLPVAAGRGPTTIRYDVHHDVSPPLVEMIRNARPVTHGKLEAEPRRSIPLPQGLRPMVEDPVRQYTTGGYSPQIGLSFEGIGDGQYGFTVEYAPPDPNGAVGATQYVQWVNTYFAVFDKTTGSLIAGPTPGNTLWTGFGGGCESNNDGDPIVLYDKLANRWVMSQFSVSTGPYLQCIAVSETSDATGPWYRYSFQYSYFDDYPKMGVWPDAYYETFNMFNGQTFMGSDACAYDRNAMLSGQLATQICFQQQFAVGGLLPSDLDGTTLPPAGSPNYMLDFGDNTLNLYKFHVDFNTPSNSTFSSVPTIISVAPFTPLCNGGQDCVPQPLTDNKLDSLADRLMYRLAYRNFGTHESLVVNQSVAVVGGGGIRWYEIQNPNGTPVVAQQGTYAPDSNYRWMGSIAMDRIGDIAVGYSVSSGAVYPSVAFAGRLPTDPPGTLEAETLVWSGSGSQTPYLTRWGDYSAMTVDPTDDCTFWYTQEYLLTTGTWNWNTRIVNFKFPGCTTGSYIGFSPQTLNFGNQTIDTTSAAQQVVLSNEQSVNLLISSITVSGDYQQTNNCGSSLPPNGNCTINVSFQPTGTGIRPGTLTVTDNGYGSPRTTNLTGLGTVPATCVPDALSNGGFESGDLSCWTAGGVLTPVASTTQDVSIYDNSVGQRFVPVTPCRVVDTRNPPGTFGGPAISGRTERDFPIPQGNCSIPATATAYAINVTVVPHGPLGYLTLWPTGSPQPSVSTLNSYDGRVKANAAIVPAGDGQAISVYATNTTDVMIDISGYFATGNNAALAFFPLTPCRVADTRNPNGPLGGPILHNGQARSFPVLASACNIPSTAQAYSFNFTAIPRNGSALGYLTVWPAGQPQPYVSTLNAPTGTVVADAAIVPAGTGGDIEAYVYGNDSHLVIDINGYFAPADSAPNPMSLYNLTPCRVLDTRQPPWGTPFVGELPVNVVNSPCGLPGSATGYVTNATVVPPASLGYLTLWPDGQQQPYVSTLNAYDGAITSNMAIVSTDNGWIDAFAFNPTYLILDISAYFAPVGSFTISASPSSLTIGQGNQGTSTITTAVSGGFNSAITLSATGVPSGTTVSFSPNPIPAPGSGNSTMTITVGASTPTGTYPITVTGNGGGVQQNTTVTLTVISPPTFILSASPSSLSVMQESQGTSSLTVTISGGFNSSVSFSASGVPSGTTVTFNPATLPAPGSGNSTMTITVGTTPMGTYPITVTATGGAVHQTTTVTLTVTAQVSLTWNASPSPGVAGYNIYRSLTSGGPYSKVNSTLDPNTTYNDMAVQDGVTYYYVTTAVDNQGQESGYSNQASATLP